MSVWNDRFTNDPKLGDVAAPVVVSVDHVVAALRNVATLKGVLPFGSIDPRAVDSGQPVSSLARGSFDGQVVRYRRTAGQPLWVLAWDSSLNGGGGAWAAVTGVPASGFVAGQVSFTRNTSASVWQAITGGPEITVPVGGVYGVRWSCSGQVTSNHVRGDERMCACVNGTPINAVGAAGSVNAQFHWIPWSGERNTVTLAAGDVITLRHYSGAASGPTWGFHQMYVSILPREVRP